MKTVKFHPQGNAHLHLSVARGRMMTACGWQHGSTTGMVFADNGDVTCPDCLAYMAAYREAIGEQQATALYFHTDYGNDDACDTLLTVFADPADAERECAKLIASIPRYDRSTMSYKTEPCTVLPAGSTYTGGAYG